MYIKQKIIFDGEAPYHLQNEYATCNQDQNKSSQNFLQEKLHQSFENKDWESMKMVFSILRRDFGSIKFDIVRLLIASVFITTRDRNSIFAHFELPYFVFSSDDALIDLKSRLMERGMQLSNVWNTLLDYMECEGLKISAFMYRLLRHELWPVCPKTIERAHNIILNQETFVNTSKDIIPCNFMSIDYGRS